MAPLFPSGPRARYPGDLLRRFRRDALGFFAEQVSAYGNVFGFRIGPQRFVFVNEPELIKDILVTHQRNFVKGRGLERAKRMLGEGLLTSEGELHLRQRRLAQPAFHRDRIAGYAAHMVTHTERLSGGWRDGQELDAHEAMMRLTLSIVAKTLFDSDVDDDAAVVGQALHEVMVSFNLALTPFAELFERLPLPSTLRFRSARARLDAIVFRMIRDRRAITKDRGDLLSMLLHATDTEGDGTGMSDEQLRDEVMTLFLAGHETTANALTWAWYLLARNPKSEAALHAEVDALGHTPTMADLPRLDFTRRVVAETMRLYPPAYALGRRAIEDYQLGPYRLPKRTIVVCSQFIQHRDARWYPKPEQFDPDRWLPEELVKRPKFSYFPFGAGTRICVGEQFAWTEAILVLATLAQKWRLWIAPKQRIAIEPRITLRPRYGMQMVARRR